VQILRADGSTPITFSDDPAQAINTGTTSGNGYAIDLDARYYRTGTPVTAGTVKGIATYTINYQ
jgi:type 1 fimbria pilin